MRWAASLALLLAACAPAQQGQRAPDGLPFIVSLNPCTDAVLAEIAAPGQLLAISHYSQEPDSTSMPFEQALEYQVTGGTVEEVLALDPDIVVAGSFLPPATMSAFERLGMRVETFGIASTFADSEEQVSRLAAMAGRKAEGEALNTRIARALTENRWDGEPVSALLWQQGGIVAGPDSLVSAMLAHTGFSSQSAARGLGQGAYLPLERVLADPPQVILAAGGERALAHAALDVLDSTHHARIDPSLTYCGGPTIIRAVERLAQVRRSV